MSGKRAILTLLLAVLLAMLPGFTSARAADSDYRLAASDTVRLTVYGEPELGGEYSLNERGEASLPLIGTVDLKGLTCAAAGDRIAGLLADGYLKNPKVALEVTSFRPFYILGEVQTPGAYPWAAGLTLVQAVAMAGGFTYRADADDVRVSRGGADEVAMPLKTAIQPGDVITVTQRFF